MNSTPERSLIIQNDYFARPSSIRLAQIRNLELAEKYNISPIEVSLLCEEFHIPPWLRHRSNINLKFTDFKNDATASSVFQKVLNDELTH